MVIRRKIDWGNRFSARRHRVRCNLDVSVPISSGFVDGGFKDAVESKGPLEFKYAKRVDRGYPCRRGRS